LACGELAAMMPRAGGQYVYLREAYGDLVAFLYGWMLFTVANGGGIAALAVAAAVYTGQVFPIVSQDHIVIALAGITITRAHLFAVLLIAILTYVNVVGLRWGALLRGTPDDPPGFVVPRAPAWYRFALQSPSATVALMAPENRAELAEDLTQETFVRAWSHLGSFQEQGALRAWLYRIAHREFLRSLRGQRAQVSLEEVAEIAAPERVVALFRSPARGGESMASWMLLFYALWHRRHILGLAPDGDVFEALAAR